jgi:hypothetical protein
VNDWTFRRARILGVTLLLLAFGPSVANAANFPISGSYEVVGKTNVGSQAKVLLRLRFTNHGQAPLYLQKILLRDFAQPPSAPSGLVSIRLNSGNAEETTQEFVVPRRQFDQWRRGALPRVVLNLQTAAGTRITQAILLDRISARKGE